MARLIKDYADKKSVAFLMILLLTEVVILRDCTALTDAPVSINANPVAGFGIAIPILVMCSASNVGTEISTGITGPLILSNSGLI